MMIMPLNHGADSIAARTWMPTYDSLPAHADEDGLVKLSYGILRLLVAEIGQHTADADATFQMLVARLQTLATTSIMTGKVPAQCDQPWSGIDNLTEKCPFGAMDEFEPWPTNGETFGEFEPWPTKAGTIDEYETLPTEAGTGTIDEFEPSPIKAEALVPVSPAPPDIPRESMSRFSLAWKQQLHVVFNQIDKDGGGTISSRELRKALIAVGVPRSRVQKLLRAADGDGSGEIDLVEWHKAVEGCSDDEMNATIKKLAHKIAQTGSVSSLDEPHKAHPLMIKPGSKRRIIWDAVIALQCMYIAAILPLTVALDEHLGDVSMDVLNRIALVIDVTFLVDVLLNFRTGYFESSGVLVMDPHKVACSYLRSWFFIDFFSSIPVDEFTSGRVGSVRFLKVLKVGKLGKVVKFVVMVLTSSSNYWVFLDFVLLSPTFRSVIRRGGMMFFTVMLCHWMACFLLLSSDWMEAYQDGALFNSWSDMYLAGLYWAMTTMSTVGFGDITPVSNLERFMMLFAMAFGGAYYGYAIGTICSVLLDRDLEVRSYHERMDQVYFWLGRHKLPKDMRSAVIRHFKSLLSEKAGVDESFVFEELSPALKKVIGEYVVDSDIRENPFFDGIPLNAVIRLKTIVQPMVAEAGHHVVSSNEAGTAMFIVREGQLHMSSYESQSSQVLPATILEPGDSFGEEILVGLAETYQYTVYAMTDSKFWMIDEGDFSSLFAHMPDVVKTIRTNVAGVQSTEG